MSGWCKCNVCGLFLGLCQGHYESERKLAERNSDETLSVSEDHLIIALAHLYSENRRLRDELASVKSREEKPHAAD